MTDYILISIIYSNLSYIKVFSGNAVVCMFAKNKSSHNIAHFYISVYPKTCLSYFICKTVNEKNIAYLNPKFTNYFNFLQFQTQALRLKIAKKIYLFFTRMIKNDSNFK